MSLAEKWSDVVYLYNDHCIPVCKKKPTGKLGEGSVRSRKPLESIGGMQARESMGCGGKGPRFCRKTQNQLELKPILYGDHGQKENQHHLWFWSFWREHRRIVRKGGLRDDCDFNFEALPQSCFQRCLEVFCRPSPLRPCRGGWRPLLKHGGESC